MTHIFDTLIIGGGPSGCTAALYAARAGLDTLMLEQLSAGGQLALTEEIDNYPGFAEGVDGFSLAGRMHDGAVRAGARTEIEQALGASLCGEVKRIETDRGARFARTVILATGCAPKKLALAGEEALRGKGISYCAVCDARFYAGKRVAVVGGGNSAAANALLLSRVCESVTLIHRRDTLRALRAEREKLMRAKNISLLLNTTVCELLHHRTLTGVRVRNVQTGRTDTLECEGLFICIGQTPQTSFLAGALTLDENGYVVADESTKTAVGGVFAAGDVRTKPLRQIVTATADGAVAAQNALAFLQ